jgi:hypothetical protein
VVNAKSEFFLLFVKKRIKIILYIIQNAEGSKEEETVRMVIENIPINLPY